MYQGPNNPAPLKVLGRTLALFLAAAAGAGADMRFWSTASGCTSTCCRWASPFCGCLRWGTPHW